jgi:hypothetical protein
MRLGRLVVAGLAAGALAGFLAGLMRPRSRGVLPGLAVAADAENPVAVCEASTADPAPIDDSGPMPGPALADPVGTATSSREGTGR